MQQPLLKQPPQFGALNDALLTTVKLSAALLLLINTNYAQAELKISGFGRLIGGISQHDNPYVQEYGNDATFKAHSLIALQADWQFSDQWSLTSQLIGRLNDKEDSGLEWLYLSYRPNASTHVKFGQLRTPFFNYSDVLDVGYAYHWLVPPTEVYASHIFRHYDGISIIKSFDHNQATTSVEAYIGSFKGAVVQDNQLNDLDFDYLGGFSVATTINNLTIRAALNAGELASSQPRDKPSLDQLRQLFASKSRESIIDDTNFNGSFTFSQLGFSYDNFDYFIKGEWTRFDHDFDLTATTTSIYLSAGYQYNDVLLHITHGRRRDKLSNMPNELPTTAEFATLRHVYQSLIDDRVSNNSYSMTLGMRWDFSVNMAFKVDLTRINYQRQTPMPATNDSVLVMGLEWVF